MKKILLFLLTLISIICFGQRKEPVIYGEIIGGFSKTTDHSEWLYGGDVNYKINKVLISARMVENYYQFVTIAMIPRELMLLLFPLVEGPKYLDDYSVLVGYVKTEDDFSFSFSAGISYNTYSQHFTTEAGNRYVIDDHFWGIPLEANIKWFKKDKEPYKILGVIPVGNPTSFGNSIGFKLLGNISKKSYVGLAVVVGIGIHKEY